MLPHDSLADASPSFSSDTLLLALSGRLPPLFKDDLVLCSVSEKLHIVRDKGLKSTLEDYTS